MPPNNPNKNPLTPPQPIEGRSEIITASDLNAVITGYASIAKILEQISSRLDVLSDMREDSDQSRQLLQTISDQLEQAKDVATENTVELRALRKFVETELVGKIVQAGIIDHQLDLRDDKSKLSTMIDLISRTMERLDRRVKWAMAVIALSVALVGGPRVVISFLEYKHSASYHEMKVDSGGHAYYTTERGDTLWVTRTHP